MTMTPPIGGPITGPSRAGMVSTDMARTRSCLGVERSRTRRPTGPIIAPAAPSAGAGDQQLRQVLGEAAGGAGQRRRATMAIRKTRLAPNRSATQPLIGRKTAEASR